MTTRKITIQMRCTSCGHVQQVNGVEQADGTRFLGSAANWCDMCHTGKPETIDPPTSSTPDQRAAQAAMISRVLPLASRIAPDDAARWVRDAISQLECENRLMRQALYSLTNPPFTGRLDSWQQAAGIARNQRDEAIVHLHALLNQRRTATQMLEAEREAREWLASIGSEQR